MRRPAGERQASAHGRTSKFGTFVINFTVKLIKCRNSSVENLELIFFHLELRGLSVISSKFGTLARLPTVDFSKPRDTRILLHRFNPTTVDYPLSKV